MGFLGGVVVLKSGHRILIRAPQVPFLVPPKTPILGVFGYFIDFGHFPIKIPIEAENFFGEGLPIELERKQKLF